MYDLVVVGGGPAGSMCAREAAFRGLHVVLIEKERVPRKKLCGGALSPRVSETLDFDISPVVQQEMHSAIIYAPSGRKVVIVREDAKAFMVKRAEFDHLLIKKAEGAGAEVLDDMRVLSVQQTKGGIRVVCQGDSFKGHLLVGADGVNSVVARSLGFREHWPNERIALCIAADIPLPPEDIKRILASAETGGFPAIEMYPWAIESGYGWCFPKRDEISLGLGYKMSDKILNLRDAWVKFVHLFEQEKEVVLNLTGRHAQRVPLAKIDKSIVARRTMLVGDAAGFVSPITGEGIYYAIRSGIIAGQIAAESLRDKNPMHIKTYKERLEQEFGTEFGAANFISNMAYKSERNIEMICELAENDPILQDHMLDFALGSRPMSRIRTDLIKRMVRHHPLQALRLLW